MKRKVYLLLFILIPIISIAQVSTGMEQDFDYGLRNLSPQTVTNPNYIVTEGTDHTYGRMNTTNLISPDRLSLSNMGRSTGLYSFASGGIVAASGTTFNVGAVNGFIVSSSSPSTTAPLPVAYPGGTGLTTPFLLTAPATYVLAKSDNTLLLQSTLPTVTEKRNNIFLGVIGHPAGTITGIGNSPDVCMNEMSQTRAMFEPTRLINEGVVPYANSTNLTLANTAGKLYGFGIGFIANGNDAPSILNIAAGAPMTTQYRTQGTTTFPNTTVADPLNYDVAGTQTAIPGSSNQATNQRFYLLQNGMIRIQYGQTIYATLTDAIAAVNSESFVVNVNATKLGILIGILSIQKGATNLANTTMARFLPVSKFGETVGAAAGIAIGTMQTAYNNSVVPNILTNSTLGGLSLQRGSAADTDAILIGKNGAGTNTSTIAGSGGAYFAGNVGIGTSSPTGKLDVFGDNTASSITFNSTSIATIGSGIRQLAINSNFNGSDYFMSLQARTNGNAASSLILNPLGGNILIGTTTDNGVDKLQVNGTINCTGLTGTPTAPTTTTTTNNSQIATTSYVKSSIAYDYNYGSAVLDFPSTSPQSSSSLTISVPGAAPGDVVSLGVPPHGAADVNTCFTAKCTTADEVEVRFNNYGTLTENPTSGLFKVRAWK